MSLLDFFKKDDIGEPPWEYDFLVNLDEGLRPLYLKKIFKYRTDEDLPIKKVGKNQWIIDKKKCKTFNQKIQWIKLHGITDLMRTCTDKVAVRDYVRERIGEEYLKPVLQIISKDGVYINPVMLNSFQHLSNEELIKELENNRTLNQVEVDTQGKELFDLIDFDKLPNAFVMKCNHGCKWQYIIKKKDEYLSVPRLMEITKRQMTGWLEQEFWPFEGFELQYKDIEPKILIEPLMRNDINKSCEEILVYCFDGKIPIIQRLQDKNTTLYDENLNIIDDVLSNGDEKINKPADDNVKLAFELSKQLKKIFGLVRIDWMLYKNKLYLEEFTFTPYSGFHYFSNEQKNNLDERLRI